MGRRPKWGRPIDGVLLLNKDTGMTSNTALQHAKRLFFAKRAGHTGSLDPLATGVLPICFGEATKFSQYLLDADKRYLSTFRLGQKTETGDCDGEQVQSCNAAHITLDAIKAVVPDFIGNISQVPSMYSALKYQGKPLYQWARDGVELPADARQPREVTVFSYEILAFRAGEYPEVDVDIHCSKGTYIRTLAEDLGDLLGVGAHVIRLHRTAAGPFDIEGTLSLAQLDSTRGDGEPDCLDQYLLPMDAPLQSLPKVIITPEMGAYFCRGQAVMDTQAYRFVAEGGKVRVCLEDGQFLGVGELLEGSIAPKRVVNP